MYLKLLILCTICLVSVTASAAKWKESSIINLKYLVQAGYELEKVIPISQGSDSTFVHMTYWTSQKSSSPLVRCIESFSLNKAKSEDRCYKLY